MSTEYPVLDNRPINKWKVTELREELKKRNLAVKGLKDELVKRLDEALRQEREALETEESEGSDRESEPTNESCDAQEDPDARKGGVNEDSEADSTVAKVETNDCSTDTEPAKDIGEVPTGDSTVAKVETIDCSTDTEPAKDISEVPSGDSTVAKVETNDCSADKEHAKDIGEVPTGDSDHFTASGERKDSKAPQEIITSVDNDAGLPVESTSTKVVPEKKVEEDEVMKSSENDDVIIEESSVPGVSLDNSGIVEEVVETKVNSAEETREPNFMGEDIPASKKIDPENEGLKPLKMDEDIPNLGSQVKPDSIPSPDASRGITAINKIDPENEVLKPLKMDAEPDLSQPSAQVHEVIPNLGSQVKSDSIPSDTLPIYVTKELNDDLNADNVQLEQEIVRPDMVPPLSNKDSSDVGVDHPMDDQIPSESHGLVGGTDDDKSSNVKFSMKHENADQSLVDVSIIEHNMDNKASNSTELPDMLSKDGNLNEAEFSCKEKESSEEEKLDVAASNEETKFQDGGGSADASFTKITDADMAEGENLEKINLDQSSADDSMEEDIVEIKNVDSEQISSEVGEKKEESRTEGPELGLEGSTNATQSDVPLDVREVSHGDENKNLDAPEKRKFQEAASSGGKEPAKRQRKWNYESIKISEPKSSSISPKSISRPNLGGSDSTHDVDTPKERIVPESSKTPTNSLRIDNFVRPFTLKAVQELLGGTGKVCSFWMDHIKTHCYVTFSSVEEAIETRKAVYNLQWPTNGGRLLVADFADPQDVKSRVDGPSKPTTPVGPAPTLPLAGQTSSHPLPPARQQGPPEQPERPHPLSRQPPASDRSTMKERPPRAPPSPIADKTEAPMVTLDDLFRKTKATPRIYYLPLTDEQVSAKLNEQRRKK